jgi:hypothetical protein
VGIVRAFRTYLRGRRREFGRLEAGGTMIFQPILPVPLHGDGANRWNFIMRPTIPVLISQPVPTGFDSFDHKAGSGTSSCRP